MTGNCVGHGELVEEAVRVGCLEWNDTADEFLNLNMVASKIHEKHFQGSSGWWKSYAGIDPGLMPAIARWYTGAEELERKIFEAQEKDRQIHFEAEHLRRRNARSPCHASGRPTTEVVNSSHQVPDTFATRAQRIWHPDSGALISNVTM
ncbi:hypothetical protein V5O48_013769 [Marasmius crinis-equi]|uniref:Uncharacterized protein n=1 Tax=Marasmius crinis-equi TaxID=585013 RepID=A0ABR3EZI8_9AGAR